jgi:mRNA-degrading endonuclease toxin of MazEF toxin-antitoxin module
MTLWAISGAPLLVGADLTTLSPVTLATLTNPDVIAVDQDSLGLQCVKISGGSGLEVWSKRLAQAGQKDSRRAVVLLNRTGSAAPITVHWSELGLEPDSASLRNLWTHEDLGAQANSYTATVPANDAVMLLVTGHEKAGERYAAVVQTNDLQRASALACGRCSQSAASGKEKFWSFHGVKSQGSWTWLQIAYTNFDQATALAELQINGQTETLVALPPTGKGRMGSITIEGNLRAQDNALIFSAPSAGGLNLDSITVLPGIE